MDLLTETLKIQFTKAIIILATPFTHLPPHSPPNPNPNPPPPPTATPHLPYHLSLSDLQLLLILAIKIPSSISPRSVKKISL